MVGHIMPPSVPPGGWPGGYPDSDYRLDPNDGLVMPPMGERLFLGDVEKARYERGRRLWFTPHYLPHTIIVTMMRERTRQRADVVSTCPAFFRLGRNETAHVDAKVMAWRRAWIAEDSRRGQSAGEKAALARLGGYDYGDRLDYRTGDYMMVDGAYYWAIDEVRYDYRHECFVAKYMDKPPAYLSKRFGAWAVGMWTVAACMERRDRAYAEWLARFQCAQWDDMIASLESSGDGVPPERILRWPRPIIGRYPSSWVAGPHVRHAR